MSSMPPIWITPLRSTSVACIKKESRIEPVPAAGHTLSGIKRFISELRTQLPTASQYFRNWQRSDRPLRAVPISWELLQAVAAICWNQGSMETALLLYAGFNCFLRTSEMFPQHTKAELAVAIPFSKTSTGDAQVLLVKDDHIWRLAGTLKRRRALTAPLWVGSPNLFRSTWAPLATFGLMITRLMAFVEAGQHGIP